MAIPSWWPYKAPPNQVFRSFLVIVAGVIVGAKAITLYYQPLKEYEEELERRKIELLRKYKAIFEERKTQALAGASGDKQQ